MVAVGVAICRVRAFSAGKVWRGQVFPCYFWRCDGTHIFNRSMIAAFVLSSSMSMPLRPDRERVLTVDVGPTHPS